MQNAAIYLHRDTIDTSAERLLGRRSAGESFLRGFMRHADVEEFCLWNADIASEEGLEELLRRIAAPEKPLRWIARHERLQLGNPGILNLPTPEIGQEAWLRRDVGSRAYAICGLTHTTATPQAMDVVADLLMAPTEAYDALICTSRAVRASVESHLDGVREYLAAERAPRRRPEPLRATIPLGANTVDFATTPDQRRTWRERLDIPASAIVALYVGRFSVQDKMNPGLMAVALERAALACGQPIYWVNSGWADTPESAEIYHRETRALCPSVNYIHIDGRPTDVRFSIWSVADFFISFSDNIQETFGITPIEAMAAGLPCVVTDWNGYKDTVRHGQDGFRIATVAPPPGAGGDLAYNLANHRISYHSYVGGAAQYTAIDYNEAVDAISTLVENADCRKRFGENARQQARTVFDWATIIPQYQALWAEQAALRRSAFADEGPRDNPFRPDPYTLFAGYPSRHLTIADRLSLPLGTTPVAALALLNSPLAAYDGVNRPTLNELEQVLSWIVDHDGAPLRDLLPNFPPDRRPYVGRGVLWMARLGAISVYPPA